MWPVLQSDMPVSHLCEWIKLMEWGTNVGKLCVFIINTALYKPIPS